MENEDVKELNVNFHHEDHLVQSMNIHVPMTWTANLFLTFLSFTSFQNDATNLCVSDIKEENEERENDICEIVGMWKERHFEILEQIGRDTEHNGVISGGEYCGC